MIFKSPRWERNSIRETNCEFIYTYIERIVSAARPSCVRRYITTTEWKNEWGGKKAARGLNDPDHVDFRRLPFDHCALSLQPYETPYADAEGHVFDLAHIVKYVWNF